MIRFCSECKGCTLMETVQGRSLYICLDEKGGAFLQEVGICGYCGEIEDGEEEADDEETHD